MRTAVSCRYLKMKRRRKMMKVMMMKILKEAKSINKMERRIEKHTKKGTKDRKAWRDDKRAEKEENKRRKQAEREKQKRRTQETIQSFMDKDPKRPPDQTMLQRLQLMKEIQSLYQDLKPDWSGQNKLYELNRDRNFCRRLRNGPDL